MCYHADNFRKTAPHGVAQGVEKVFRAIETAYMVLAAPVQKRIYDWQTSNSTTASAEWYRGCGPVALICANEVARSAFPEGVQLYNPGAYPAANSFSALIAVRIRRLPGRRDNPARFPRQLLIPSPQPYSYKAISYTLNEKAPPHRGREKTNERFPAVPADHVDAWLHVANRNR